MEDILNDDEGKEYFVRMFRQLSKETEYKFWFAVIPGIKDPEGDDIVNSRSSNAGPWADDLEDDEDVDPKKKAKADHGYTSLTGAKEMMDLLKNAHITTFISYKASELSGFANLTADLVKRYKKDMNIFADNKFAVFCYPNFTILPAEKGYADISDTRTIKLPGIYIDASYVAAGLMVSTQNYRYLKEKGLKLVNKDYPCVRFDIEDTVHQKKIVTTMNRELNAQLDSGAKAAANEDQFGFFFVTDYTSRKDDSGRPIGVLTNAYVSHARCLVKDSKGNYSAIYRQLVEELFYRVIEFIDDKPKESTIIEFQKNYVERWIADNKVDERKYANRILRENEDTSFDPAEHTLSIKLAGQEMPMNDLKVQSQ